MLKKYSKLIKIIGLPILILVSFFLSQIIVVIIFRLLNIFGISPDSFIRLPILQSVLSVIVYLLTTLIIVLTSWKVAGSKLGLADFGLNKLPTWTDLILAPAGFVIYIFSSGIIIYLASNFLPWFNTEQPQELGFGNLNYNYEYLIVFMAIVVIGPFFEEILFRGYLFNKLAGKIPSWLSILINSLLFTALHIDWPSFFKSFDFGLVFGSLTFDIFILSIVLCLLTKSAKSVWPAIVLHMIKNSLAFIVLFIYPMFLLK